MALEWYVLRVASGRESTLRDALQKKIQLSGLEEEIPTVLVPTEQVSEIKGGKKRLRERKLFPGYIIVEMDLVDDVWYLMRVWSSTQVMGQASSRPSASTTSAARLQRLARRGAE